MHVAAMVLVVEYTLMIVSWLHGSTARVCVAAPDIDHEFAVDRHRCGGADFESFLEVLLECVAHWLQSPVAHVPCTSIVVTPRRPFASCRTARMAKSKVSTASPNRSQPQFGKFP